jgi:transcriptional regulator with GAF, ATPase, and Fis domain
MTDPFEPRPARKKTTVPPAAEHGPYSLTIHAPNKDPWVLALETGREFLIGRDASADIRLDYPWISQRHAQIVVSEPPRILDLGSRNGTKLNAEPLTPSSPRPLSAGSVISLGGITILVARSDEVTSVMLRRAPTEGSSGAASTSRPTSGRARRHTVPVVMRDPRMRELWQFAKELAQTSVSVLIIGETGVGKELLAQALHKYSQRADQRLVTLNSAAIPHNLVESELFGYERGAFSGAVSAKPGLFEVADGSTFFLDEIGELPIAVQSKLLRVLETGDVMRLGAVRSTRVDVRLVSATNRNLEAHVADGTFRADLFYRLNGFTLCIPALRERPDDIDALAHQFAANAGLTAQPFFTPRALDALHEHAWPGNVRELKSVIERAAILARRGTIDSPQLLLPTSQAAPAPSSRAPMPSLSGDDSPPSFSAEELPTNVVRAELEKRERRRIQEALERTGGNQTDAAKLLGISRRTLMNRLDRYAMNRPRKRRDGADEG